MTHVINVTIWIVLIILTFNALYLFIFSFAGVYFKDSPNKKSNIAAPLRFLILLPGFQEDEVILNSVQTVLNQNYPRHLFECVVIADGFKDSTIAEIKRSGATVHVLTDDPKRNKAKAINAYLNCNKTRFDICLILDADNCINSDTLSKATIYFNNGTHILQSQRVAKNKNNKLARLDALSEIINNHIFRKGQRSLGFSASLIGSGMFFTMPLFIELMKDMDIYSGFDKELELRILERGLLIEYSSSIEVYDEKVSQQNVFVNQRRRWINAQIYFLRKNVMNAYYHLLIKRNVDYFNKVLQFALLPRVLSLGLSFAVIPFFYFISPFDFAYSICVAFIITISLFIPIVKYLTIREICSLSLKFPKVFTGMLKACFTSGQATGKFIHTPHNS